MTTLPAAPGDVLAVTAGAWLPRTLIEVGERLRGMPAAYCRTDHVIVVTHQDQAARWTGVQGQPGGVGLVDCTPYLASPLTRSNHGQPRPDDHGQAGVFLAACARSLGVAYDWAGIADDAAAALHVPDLAGAIDRLWRWPADHGQIPGEVVCSSLAAMLYDLPAVGWAHPDLGTERMCEPSDWWRWNDGEQWRAA